MAKSIFVNTPQTKTLVLRTTPGLEYLKFGKPLSNTGFIMIDLKNIVLKPIDSQVHNKAMFIFSLSGQKKTNKINAIQSLSGSLLSERLIQYCDDEIAKFTDEYEKRDLRIKKTSPNNDMHHKCIKINHKLYSKISKYGTKKEEFKVCLAQQKEAIAKLADRDFSLQVVKEYDYPQKDRVFAFLDLSATGNSYAIKITMNDIPDTFKCNMLGESLAAYAFSHPISFKTEFHTVPAIVIASDQMEIRNPLPIISIEGGAFALSIAAKAIAESMAALFGVYAVSKCDETGVTSSRKGASAFHTPEGYFE